MLQPSENHKQVCATSHGSEPFTQLHPQHEPFPQWPAHAMQTARISLSVSIRSRARARACVCLRRANESAVTIRAVTRAQPGAATMVDSSTTRTPGKSGVYVPLGCSLRHDVATEYVARHGQNSARMAAFRAVFALCCAVCCVLRVCARMRMRKAIFRVGVGWGYYGCRVDLEKPCVRSRAVPVQCAARTPS